MIVTSMGNGRVGAGLFGFLALLGVGNLHSRSTPRQHRGAIDLFELGATFAGPDRALIPLVSLGGP